MEKQRMFKMSQLEQDMLVKALCDTQNDVQPEQAEEMRSLAAKTVRAPRRRLYLSDEEFGRAVQALNRKRNAYLSLSMGAAFVREKYGIPMEIAPIVCDDFSRNGQCIGERCPFHPKGA